MSGLLSYFDVCCRQNNYNNNINNNKYFNINDSTKAEALS